MKNLFIYAAVIAATMGSMTACSDFLDVKPVTNKQEPDFVSQEGITQLLTGMYARLNSTDANDGYFRSTLTNYVYGDVMGGDANKGSTFQDQPDFTSLETYTFTTDNAYFETKWAHSYHGVFTANNVIKVADLAKEELSAIAGQSKDFYTETIAQARFIRGFFHFEVVKLFGAAVPYVDDIAMKENVNKMPGIAVFRDEFRDSLRGPFGNDKKGAFLIGRPNHEQGVRFGISGGTYPLTPNDSCTGSPLQFISYVSCHDDLCLTDRLKATLPGASVQELGSLQKLAATALLTSQGVPILFAGDEFLRTRQGKPNPYNLPDEVNAIRWNDKALHRDVFDYYRGLIAMRKGHPAFRMGDAALIREHLEFIPVPASSVVAFRLKGNPCGDAWLNTIVVLNARTEAVKVNIPEGKYWVVCQNGKVDLVLGLGTITGNQLQVAPRSATIIHQ